MICEAFSWQLLQSLPKFFVWRRESEFIKLSVLASWYSPQWINVSCLNSSCVLIVTRDTMIASKEESSIHVAIRGAWLAYLMMAFAHSVHVSRGYSFDFLLSTLCFQQFTGFAAYSCCPRVISSRLHIQRCLTILKPRNLI